MSTPLQLPSLSPERPRARHSPEPSFTVAPSASSSSRHPYSTRSPRLAFRMRPLSASSSRTRASDASGKRQKSRMGRTGSRKCDAGVSSIDDANAVVRCLNSRLSTLDYELAAKGSYYFPPKRRWAMSTPRQKPIDCAAEGLSLASLSIPTAESGFKRNCPRYCFLLLLAM